MTRNNSTEETRQSLLVKVSGGDGDSWAEFFELYLRCS
jgi:hypothetical protein